MILYLAVGLAVALAIAAFLAGMRRAAQPTEEVDERIEEWLTDQRTQGKRDARGSTTGVLLDQVERSLSRRGFAENIKIDLARADLIMTVTEYLAVRILVIASCFLIGYLIQRNVLAGLMLGVVGIFLPVLWVRQRQSRRLRAFNGQLPDVLDHMVGSLRAGYGLLQSVEWVGRQLPAPAGTEFDRVVREVQLGRSLSEALNGMLRRIDSDDLALIITAINIQHEVGGNMADILETVANTIRERVRILGEIRVLTAQQRYSGYVLMFMPIALGIFLYIINPEYESQLFAPGPTICLPIGAILMMGLGFLLMRRIIEIDV